jgi:hypothetical protein
MRHAVNILSKLQHEPNGKIFPNHFDRKLFVRFRERNALYIVTSFLRKILCELVQIFWSAPGKQILAFATASVSYIVYTGPVSLVIITHIIFSSRRSEMLYFGWWELRSWLNLYDRYDHMENRFNKSVHKLSTSCFRTTCS